MVERVTLRFRGLMLEKFIQRALDAGVTFEIVRHTGRREACLVTDAPGAERLLKLSERFALDVTELNRTGLGVLKRRILHRITLPIALMLGLALMFVFLSRMWLIDIRLLDDSGDATPIVQALNDLRVAPGMSMLGIDTKQLALALEANTGEFAYIGARKQGVRLLIEAVRELPAPDLYDPAATRDLVASRDALLVSLDVMAGRPAVKSGQVVRRGQVLVYGEERTREATRGVCALGAAIGRVWLTGEAEASLTGQRRVDTGRRASQSELRFLNYALPLNSGDGFETQRVEVERLPIVGLILPLHIVRTTYIEQEIEPAPIDMEAVKNEITQIALDRALAQLPSGVSPVDKWVDYSMIEGENIKARAVLEIRINIAVARGAIEQLP